MKLNKKITMISAAALMLATPALSLVAQSPMPVLAAKISEQGTLQTSSSLVYDSKGKILNSNVKPNTNIKFYGTQRKINGTLGYDSELYPITRIINGNSYIDLGDGGYINSHNMGSFDGKTGQIEVLYNTYIYNKNGKRLKTYRGKKAYVAKNKTITLAFKKSYYNAAMYFSIGNGRYVKASNVTKLNGKGVLGLNYNTYVYNKKGKRLKGKLLKGSIITYSGKISDADAKKDRYYFYESYRNGTPKKLATHRINNKDYYYVGNGGYVKADNVGTINGKPVYTNDATYVKPMSDQYILDKDLNPTNEIARRGQKIKVDQAVYTGYGDTSQLYFKLADKDDRYISWGDFADYPEEIENGAVSSLYVRFNLVPVKYLNVVNSHISFKDAKNTPLYDLNGEKIKLTGKYLELTDDSNQLPEQVYEVDGAWYIWNPQEKKAELYYHMVDTAYSVFDPTDKLPYHYSQQNITNAFVKASDVNFMGVAVKTQNTQAEAEKQTAFATSSEKEKLAKTITNADSIKNSEKYKLTTQNKRANYDGAVAAIKAAVKSDKTTIFEANELKWWLESSQKALDGAKVKVKNIKKLSALDAARVQKVMTNANSGLSGFVDVAIYQHWAHKDGYYPSYSWVSSEKSVFMLRRNGYKNKILNVADYATEK